MSRGMNDYEILAELDELLANAESDDEFGFDDTFPLDDDIQTQDCDNDEIFEIDIDPHQSPSTPEIRPITCLQKPRNIPKVKTKKKQGLTTPNFKWKSGPFKPNIHEFDSSESGIKKIEFELGENSPVIDFFECFFTPSLLGKVAFETNRYYRQNTENQDLGDRDKRWYDTTSEEMYLFIAINMLMARNKKLELQEYWSTDPLLYTPIFGQIMSRNRYQILLRYIHFTNNEHQAANDRLYKIKMVLNEVKKNFRDAMVPFQSLVIDESLLLWKGRLSFKQFIRTKRHRFGIKFFILCDVETDFILDFVIYTGKTTELKACDVNLGQSGAVVCTLLRGYLKKGRTLFTDNWYTSPLLSTYLHKNKTNSCGTVRKTRRGMPELKNKLKIGETQSLHTNKMLAMRWLDRRDVYMLTTCFTDKMLCTGKTDIENKNIRKPDCIIKYNESMGSVDKTDMLLSSVECVRKTIKWYKKVYFHLIDMSLLNSYSAYKQVTGKNPPLADFQLTLIRQIMDRYKSTVKSPKLYRKKDDELLQGKKKHFLSEVQSTAQGKFARRRCVICSINKKRKDTKYFCKECKVGLCAVPCFELYHKNK
ncbi:piggyBac transposable element-derived protein 4-like [Metopolophium dirhodum]|uniref:piggyBac transposable element-derived protein 4-like n=1 Tax=Metopolophium dirhodum TaxID=44670 RepID=UPI002990498F|nr:piggyBac transposable element-derived protein 4-like [Metopolophium dirhodum]